MKKGVLVLMVLSMAVAGGCAPIQWQHVSHNDPEIFNRDNYECAYQAQMYGMDAGTHYDYVNPNVSTGAQIGQMFANAFVNAATQTVAARAEYINCMTSLGYYQVNIQTASAAPQPYTYQAASFTPQAKAVSPQNLMAMLNLCTNPEACVKSGHDDGYSYKEMSNITNNRVILEYLFPTPIEEFFRNLAQKERTVEPIALDQTNIDRAFEQDKN